MKPIKKLDIEEYNAVNALKGLGEWHWLPDLMEAINCVLAKVNELVERVNELSKDSGQKP